MGEWGERERAIAMGVLAALALVVALVRVWREDRRLERASLARRAERVGVCPVCKGTHGNGNRP